jgi:RNA polymerase sigma-70 factor (ECF subfamily)
MTDRQTEAMTLVELLYQKYYRRLYLYALTLLGDEDEAKDTVSEVFAAIWQMWDDDGSQQPRQPNATFMYKTTRNRCLDRLRHNRAAANYQAMLTATDFISDETDVADYEERIGRLHEAFGRLPEPSRSILWHCYFKRLTYQQTAEALQLTVPVVHRHIMKAFKLLREMLKSQK